MIKAILKHKNTRKKEEIELPDTADTGDIICVISETMRNFDGSEVIRNLGYDCIGKEIFEIALEDGRVYHCYELVPNKYRLYEAGFDEDGEYYCCIADFMLRR